LPKTLWALGCPADETADPKMPSLANKDLHAMYHNKADKFYGISFSSSVQKNKLARGP